MRSVRSFSTLELADDWTYVRKYIYTLKKTTLKFEKYCTYMCVNIEKWSTNKKWILSDTLIHVLNIITAITIKIFKYYALNFNRDYFSSLICKYVVNYTVYHSCVIEQVFLGKLDFNSNTFWKTIRQHVQ